MSSQSTGTTPPVTPVASPEDLRAVSILSTEHWNLLSSRALDFGTTPIFGTTSRACCVS